MLCLWGSWAAHPWHVVPATVVALVPRYAFPFPNMHSAGERGGLVKAARTQGAKGPRPRRPASAATGPVVARLEPVPEPTVHAARPAGSPMRSRAWTRSRGEQGWDGNVAGTQVVAVTQLRVRAPPGGSAGSRASGSWSGSRHPLSPGSQQCALEGFPGNQSWLELCLESPPSGVNRVTEVTWHAFPKLVPHLGPREWGSHRSPRDLTGLACGRGGAPAP